MRDWSDRKDRTATRSAKGEDESASDWCWVEATLIAIAVIAGYVGFGWTVVNWAFRSLS